jgi:hypothetical protein
VITQADTCRKYVLPKLYAVDALKKPQVQTSTELDGLLPSILDRVFKGEL